ncbi:MAG: TIGR02147 family protein [Bdellovibrionales bacterium]|nr:TIGR02147 family protein [Bdellovibrionales bacterium]
MTSPLEVLLKKKLKDIQTKNTRFSMRSLAAKIGISPGALGDLMKGKRALSDFYAEKIAAGLHLKEEERKALFAAVTTRSRKFGKQKILAENEFSMITDWENYAILNLMKTKDFRSDVAWIAERLAIPESQVKKSVKVMMDLDLIISRQGEWIRNHNSISTTREIPSRYIVEAHKKDLLKAIEMLEKTPLSARSYTSITMPINTAKIEEARKLIRKFRRNLCLLMETGPKDEVYNLNIQLYPVTKLQSNEGKRL